MKPTVSTRLQWKGWLRSKRHLFNSNILECKIEDIKDVFVSRAGSVNDSDKVKILLTKSYGYVDIHNEDLEGKLFYIPALPGDKISVGVSTDGTAHQLTFDTSETSIIYSGTSYGLNSTLTLSGQEFKVVGLGGGLIQGQGSGPPPPPPATYTVGQNSTSISEGGSVTYTVTTTNVDDATTLYYTLSGTATADDFVGGTLAGSFLINNNTGSFSVNVVGDIITDDGETFTANIRTDSTSGTIVATASEVTITDVGQTEAITQSATTINEGDLITFTLSTTGYAPGTTFWWDIESTDGITAADFSDGLLSGTMTTNVVEPLGKAYLVKQLAQDLTTEGIEKFKLNIRSGSASGSIILSSSEITINDTSVSIGANANGKTFGPVNVNRDNGNTSLASDWYTICNIDSIPNGSKVAMFIDTSGSMTMSTIQASYDLLVSKLNERGITIISVTNSNEDWITPFLTELA